MKNYEIVFFDLDGTLTDSGPGITHSVAYALEKFGIHVEDRSVLNRFVGPPLKTSFGEFYGFTPEDAQKATGYYREYYEQGGGMFENEVYQGIEALLKTLRAAGKSLVVATSKPEKYARMILEHFHLAGYFDYIAGASMDGSRIEKEQVIDYALKVCRVKDTSKVVMVGDREYDVLGARRFGIDSIGVLFGYGSRPELEKAGADYIADQVEDIGRLILGSGEKGCQVTG